ncbi:MAG: hypothetical protein NTZ26_12115 [Candidatus Aminicenantes bacterium]|nr:hypothetical protein [Candidatus Aminicenantes bacterium]
MSDSEDRLVSWKEIAAHLGIDERTCQRWEKKYGLPVRRIDPATKSRVFAFKTELDAWRERMSGPNGSLREPDQEARPAPAAHRSGRTRLVWGLGALVILGGALSLLLARPFADRTPADFRIDGSRLIITDKAGHELWTHDTKMENLWEEKFYRERFQKDALITDNVSALTLEPLLLIKDLDEDGRREVLFAPVTADDLKTGQLILSDDRGRERWTHGPARPVRVGTRDFSGEYVTSFIEARDLDHDGRPEIIWCTHARGEYPTRTLLLDAADQVLGEYWNAGQINEIGFADLNGDGREEILLAGQNEEYQRPCLVVLDAGDMKGCSPQSPAYQFAGMPPGREKAYILFPLTPVDRLAGPGVTFDLLDVLDGRVLGLTSSISGIQYYFDFSLGLIKTTASDNYERIYQARFREGLIREPFQKDRIERELSAGVRYLDGLSGQWVNRLAMSHSW